MFKKHTVLSIAVVLAGCTHSQEPPIIPAEEFSKALHNGTVSEYSFNRIEENRIKEAKLEAQKEGLEENHNEQTVLAKDPQARAQFGGDPRYLSAGYELKKSLNIPSPQIENTEGAVLTRTAMLEGQHPSPFPGRSTQIPPGSSAPYLNGQMTGNPSLWPDESQGAYLFSDYRAFRAMDIITIVINEDTKGNKKAKTDAESKYSLMASISNFLGIETRKWAENNPDLEPSSMINAETNAKFNGDTKMERSGSLKAKVSAVIMEVFPNGLMRVEGTKIVSMDTEEEIVVISGLVRARDIDSSNLVDSARIANMRIDLYGQGLLAEHNKPGWGARAFEYIWPF